MTMNRRVEARKLFFARKNINAPAVERDRKAKAEQVKIANRLRARFKAAFRSNAKRGSAVRDLGCTIAHLIVWLESLFQIGMSWANYGAWHIDHKVPLSSFDLTRPEQVRAACHWSNLQPLWARDNLCKGAKTTWQPELTGMAALVAA
jgi:hypothetical protein